MKMASLGVGNGVRLAVAVAAISLLASSHAMATNLFWSGNGTTQGGAGTWTTTTGHFDPVATGTPAGTYSVIWNNAASPVDSAEFGVTGGQVNTAAGGITVNVIKTTVTGYIIGNGNTATNNAMTFSGANSGITTPAAGTLTTIQTAFTGTLTKAGGGRLEMGNGFNPNANSIKYVITAGDITTASIARLSANQPTTFVPDFLTFDGGGWAINTGSQDTGANRGITIKAGGAFFGTSSTTVATTVSSVISGTAGGGLNSTNAGPFTGNTSSAAGGNVILTAVNTYDGPTTITGSASKITVDADATLGNGAGTLNLAGGTLNTSASRALADPIPNPISMTASSAITTTSSAANVNFIFTSNTVGGTGGTLTFRNDGADAATDVFDPRFTGSGFNFSRPIAMPDGVLASKTRLSTFNATATTNTFSGVISGTGSFRRSATSPDTGGDTILSGNNTYSGGTLITGGGIGFGSSTDAGLTQGPIGTGTLTVNSSSASVFASGAPRVVSNPVVLTSQLTVKGSQQLELSGTVDLGAVSRTMTITNTQNTILSGVISGTTGSAIVKQGGGVLLLSGANTYGTAGVTSTTVSAGKLLVNNITGSGTGPGDVLVNGGTLGGTGKIAGSVSVTSGSLSPGASINVLGIGGNLSFTGGSFDYEINRDVAPAVGADLNNVSGNLSLASVALAAADLGVGAAPLAMGTKFTLINYGGTWNGGIFTGYANHSTNLVIGLNRFQIDYDNTTGGVNFGGGSVGAGSHFVTITAVPEASTFLTIGLGGIFAIAAVWMSKRVGINVLKS
jgi:autotransporter-associated beta strand protein